MSGELKGSGSARANAAHEITPSSPGKGSGDALGVTQEQLAQQRNEIRDGSAAAVGAHIATGGHTKH